MADEGTTEVEWGVRWNDEDGGIVDYGPGGNGRMQALNVAEIYGYGTPESQVSIVKRTVTCTPWTVADSDDE